MRESYPGLPVVGPVEITRSTRRPTLPRRGRRRCLDVGADVCPTWGPTFPRRGSAGIVLPRAATTAPRQLDERVDHVDVEPESELIERRES